MAIKITPEPKIKTSLWITIFGIFCIILVLALLANYFYLDRLIKQMVQEIQEKEKAMVVTPSEKALEDELYLLEGRINNFSELLSEHGKPLNIFNFLESTCLPNVQLSTFNFTSEKNEVSVSGQADSFVVLGQQILVLGQEPLLKNLNLSEISMSEEGKVGFAFLLTFDPQIFK